MRDKIETWHSHQMAEYGRALELMQYETQRLWLIFGTFLLTESVLLGGLATAIKDGPQIIVISGAILGLLLLIPWLFAMEYCRLFYLLRIDQARQFENDSGLLAQGEAFSRGVVVRGRRIGTFTRWLRPQHAAWLLMLLFAISFAGVGFFAWQFRGVGPNQAQTNGLLSGSNSIPASNPHSTRNR